jgi:hypothetical protein
LRERQYFKRLNGGGMVGVMESGYPARRICGRDATPTEKTMQSIILTSLLGTVLATLTGSGVRELARTGSTITVHRVFNGR